MSNDPEFDALYNELLELKKALSSLIDLGESYKHSGWTFSLAMQTLKTFLKMLEEYKHLVE